MLISINLFAQEKREKIKDFENQQIILDNGFAGESMTLVKETRHFYVVRKIFGSGIPVVRTIKYKVKFASAYQIEFSEIINETGKLESPELIEYFKMSVLKGQLNLYLNGLKLEIENYVAQQ